MLFAGWEVRIENAAFPSPRTQFLTIRTVSDKLFFSKLSNENKLTENTNASVADHGQRWGNPDRSKHQSYCRIRYRARFKKK